MSTHRDDLHARIRRFWDADAATYDRSVGHGIEHPAAAGAWRAALARHLPPAPDVLDVGAGTGAMALLAAELGHRVTALDISPEMLARAERKAAERRVPLDTIVGTAEAPPPGPFDAVLERHLLWTLPGPVGALERWRAVTRPGGRLLLYEGRWGVGALSTRVRRKAAELARQLLRTEPDHHGDYDPEVRSALPMSGALDIDTVMAGAERAGWRAPRIERLTDVEWAYRVASPPVLGWLESVPRFVVLADA